MEPRVNPARFVEASEVARFLQAAATVSNGFILRDDFDPIIEDVVRRNYFIIDRIQKEEAEAETVNDIRQTSLPGAQFTDKRNLDTLTLTPPVRTVGNAEVVKAVSGAVSFPLFDRRLYRRQGEQFGDLMARDTNDLINACLITIEKAILRGDASVNALEFNGLTKQVTSTATIDLSSGWTPSQQGLITGLRDIVSRMIDDEDVDVRPSAIYCRAALPRLIEREMREGGTYQLPQVEIAPGMRVSAIQTDSPVNNGLIPFIVTPYAERTQNSGSPAIDTLTVYIVDESRLVLKYIEAADGVQWRPAVFDNVNPVDFSQVERRQVVWFGTLYVRNRDKAHKKVTIKLPANTL
ncbi:MAG: hypothetical protein V2G41_09285 [bacterium JZ-2024 1]